MDRYSLLSKGKVCVKIKKLIGRKPNAYHPSSSIKKEEREQPYYKIFIIF